MSHIPIGYMGATLSVLKKRSGQALSQQFPLRLILTVVAHTAHEMRSLNAAPYNGLFTPLFELPKVIARSFMARVQPYAP